jgi:uncharacterized membrane protein
MNSAANASALFGAHTDVNVNQTERVISAFGGGLLTSYGLSRRSLGGLALAAAGGVLIHRGVTGVCNTYRLLGIQTAGTDPTLRPLHIEEALTIARPREALYMFWRDVEKLPDFMHHLKAVRHIDEKRSYWEARIPKDMGTLSWEAEIVEEMPGERIYWRSLPGADVHHSGTVQFADAPGGGTELRVTITIRPPAGPIGAAVGSWLTPGLEQLLREDIRRFRNLMETGEIPTTTGQSHGIR